MHGCSSVEDEAKSLKTGCRGPQAEPDSEGCTGKEKLSASLDIAHFNAFLSFLCQDALLQHGSVLYIEVGQGSVHMAFMML